MNGSGDSPAEQPVDPLTILEAVISIQAEIDVMRGKFSWWDWAGVVGLALVVVVVCGAVLAAGVGTGPLSGGTSILAAVVVCVGALWAFIDHCLDVRDQTVEMVEEQIAIKAKIREIEERLGLPPQ